MLPQNKICLLGKGILSFKWQLSYSVMEVQFYLMDLIAQFAAPTSHCVGSQERVWVELQDQCQNKTETRRGGKWGGERTARKSTRTSCQKNQAGLISVTASEGDSSGVLKDSSASSNWEQEMKLWALNSIPCPVHFWQSAFCLGSCQEYTKWLRELVQHWTAGFDSFRISKIILRKAPFKIKFCSKSTIIHVQHLIWDRWVSFSLKTIYFFQRTGLVFQALRVQHASRNEKSVIIPEII